MTFSLDKETMDIACPNCGRKIKERLGRLKNSPVINCPGCKQRIEVDASSLRAALQRVEQAFRRLDDSLKRLGKR
jgi:DNA-directed RNA polymerase subunit RPC12/RpoP